MLTHSMGSIVLEAFVLNEGGETITGVFDTVVINASASAGKNHAEWVEKMNFSDNIYITVNQHDPTLGQAEFHEAWRYRDSEWCLLGKSLVSKDGKNYALACNAKYVYLAKSPLRHVYYLHRYLKDSPVVKLYYDRVLNGLPAMLDKAHGLMKIERKKIYVLERKLYAF